MANVKNYRMQGGDHWVIGGRLSEDDGTTVYDTPRGVDFTISAEGTPGANQITVSMQFYADPQNTVEVSNVVHAPFYLTESTSTLALSADANAAIAGGTDGAVVEVITNYSGYLVTEADGDVDLVITDTGTPTFYVVVLLPTGRTVISDAVTFA